MVAPNILQLLQRQGTYSSYANGYGIGIVCGHNGNLFIYSSNEYIPVEIYNYLAGKFYQECEDEYNAQVLALKSLSKSYHIYFKEVH